MNFANFLVIVAVIGFVSLLGYVAYLNSVEVNQWHKYCKSQKLEPVHLENKRMCYDRVTQKVTLPY